VAGHRRRSGKKLLGYRARGGSQYGDQLGVKAEPNKGQGRRKRVGRGPTGEQQKRLAELCRTLGERYPKPPPKTAVIAARMIDQREAWLAHENEAQ
jgi:hypothetical protein